MDIAKKPIVAAKARPARSVVALIADRVRLQEPIIAGEIKVTSRAAPTTFQEKRQP